ncbi:ATP-dependent dethiobiotin synthetase BioD [Chryseobacterium sp. P1-3]|uniref:ATP-dependent dethiobiotin synthetase BioD n=1 Tax=Chryseobacterium gallinarum TaxID=1324352 RepID=A0A0G3M686_CHRGL|nr:MULTISPECIES: dethiobiotin synthase [Chryseobacterium]AKK74130.1 ATP-dependent dethiobiotin synthetase BioD [Chryseobacterium gallinarum]KFF74646.1 ATP-dependent dethiobiotin synthetase BioD [Chryseobacterium sp. P1-3]
MKIFITGIGTEIGKTVCSAILVQHFKADYWKPVQSGDLHNTDSNKIKNWTDSPFCHPETYRLQLAASPHQSAREENVHIKLDDFRLPDTENILIVEGAGGLMVPLSDNRFMIDLVETLNLPAALVIRNYLGCINHSLLSIMALQQRNIPLEYLILNGEFPEDTERVICSFIEKDTKIIRIPEIGQPDRQTITTAAKALTITNL